MINPRNMLRLTTVVAATAALAAAPHATTALASNATAAATAAAPRPHQAAPAAPDPGSAQQEDWDEVKIRSVATGGAILPFSGGTADRTNVDMIGWHKTGQTWRILGAGTVGGQPAVQIENRNARGMCLEAKESPGSNAGYDTYIRTCDRDRPTRSQQWLLRHSANQWSHYQIVSAARTGKALTPANLTDDWGRLELKTPDDSVAFSWTIDAQY